VIKKTHIDSFKKSTVSGNRTNKINSYLQQSDFYSNTNLDSSLYYAKKALNESKLIKNDSLLSEVYNTLANAYEYKGQVDSSITFHYQALDKRKKLKNNILIADSYNNLGVANDQLGKFKESLAFYFKALILYEKENHLAKKAMTLGNIGIVYKQQKSFEKALHYYKKANEIYLELHDEFGIVVTNGNIGSVLNDLHRYSESILYSEKAVNGYTKLKYDRYVPYSITNVAIAQDSLKRYSDAEINYSKAISLHKKYGNNYETANALNALATCLIKQKKFKESIVVSNESSFYITKTDAEKLKLNQLKNLAKANAGLGEFAKAFLFYEKYNQLKDTLFENEKTKALFEIETLYETEKKEKELAKEKVKVTQRELEIKQKDTQLFFALGLTLTVFLVSYLLYKQQKTKNRQLKKEAELKEALVKIETQNKLQEQRLQISRDLHDNIGSQLTFIISSIDNLKYFDIAKEKLVSKFDDISGFTKNTITELRDTIWAMNKNAITLEDLQIRITNFIDQAKLATQGISFDFSIDEQVNASHEFSSIEGMNIYRIIQEAVNNAIKYANASQIKIQLQQESNKMIFSISDNGIGFSENEIELGNGLNNMKKRALELKADLKINAEKGNGTIVTIVKEIA
jgi:signal transduction histidine kinase